MQFHITLKTHAELKKQHITKNLKHHTDRVQKSLMNCNLMNFSKILVLMIQKISIDALKLLTFVLILPKSDAYKIVFNRRLLKSTTDEIK